MALFVGAGSIMLPTVAGGALASWRWDWRPWARLVALLPTPIVPVGVLLHHGREGLTLATATGTTLFVITYALAIAGLRPVVERSAESVRMPRFARIVLGAAGLLAAAGAVVLAAGVPTSDL
jgi:hypothetical protein